MTLSFPGRIEVAPGIDVEEVRLYILTRYIITPGGNGSLPTLALSLDFNSTERGTREEVCDLIQVYEGQYLVASVLLEPDAEDLEDTEPRRLHVLICRNRFERWQVTAAVLSEQVRIPTSLEMASIYDRLLNG